MSSTCGACWRRFLRREGYEVITAANGFVEELSGMSANVHKVDHDIKMPGIDGMGLSRSCRPITRTLPVGMITAHGSVENAVEGVKAGRLRLSREAVREEQIRQIVQPAMNTYALGAATPRPRCAGARALPASRPVRRHPPDLVAVEKVADSRRRC